MERQLTSQLSEYKFLRHCFRYGWLCLDLSSNLFFRNPNLVGESHWYRCQGRALQLRLHRGPQSGFVEHQYELAQLQCGHIKDPPSSIYLKIKF